MIPWTYTDLLKQINDASPTPILTGEGIFLEEPFRVLCERHTVEDSSRSATSGGILETHKIGDMAEEYLWRADGDATSPERLSVAWPTCIVPPLPRIFWRFEDHSLDVPWWSSLVEEGVSTPIVNHGWIEVPRSAGPRSDSQRGRRAATSHARDRLLRANAPVGPGTLLGSGLELRLSMSNRPYRGRHYTDRRSVLR